MQSDAKAIAGLVDRLRERIDSGHRTLGGGTVDHNGKGSMWGNHPIMVLRNPNGPEAAAEIERLTAALAVKVQLERTDDDRPAR